MDRLGHTLTKTGEETMTIRPQRRRLSAVKRRELAAALSAAYDALYADSAAAAAYQAEFAAWERLASEPLWPEQWTEDDFLPPAR